MSETCHTSAKALNKDSTLNISLELNGQKYLQFAVNVTKGALFQLSCTTGSVTMYFSTVNNPDRALFDYSMDADSLKPARFYLDSDACRTFKLGASSEQEQSLSSSGNQTS